jgi:hypothetical protein
MDNDHPAKFHSSLMSPSDFALMAIHGKIWALLKTIYTDTISELESSLQNLCFLCRSKIQDGRHRNT